MRLKSLFIVLLVISMIPASFADVNPTIIEEKELIAPYNPRIDVVFVIDSTGSMSDEIRTIKTHLIKIINDVRDGQPSPILRVGVVTYRDHKEQEHEYLVKKLDLTTNVDKAIDFIWDIKASGGGDHPEAVADGLNTAIENMNWNRYYIEDEQDIGQDIGEEHYVVNVKRLIFLVGDAAPHGVGSSDGSYEQGCPFGNSYKQNIEDANDKDITIYTVSGSGIDSVGKKVFKTIASETGGKYTHLRYIRQQVEEYYESEGFSEEQIVEYSKEAKASADYDERSNSILTNTLGIFALSNMKSEAMDMGVRYDDEPKVDPRPSEVEPELFDVDEIINPTVDEEEDVVVSPAINVVSESKFESFLRAAFERIKFWS